MVQFSIAMATYNGEEYLRQQLESLAAQTLLPAELQVGDDGSTDSTLAVVEEFARRAPFPVIVHSNRRNLGFGGNFIATARRCHGDWIAFCDQDDVWAADKLAWAATEIDKGPDDLALIVHNATVSDEQLRPLRKLYDYPAHDVTPPLGLPPEFYCIGATQIFRRDLVEDIPSDRRPSFPWHSHREAHDVWIALLGNIVGSVLRSDRQLILYRRHAQTVTDQAKTVADSQWLRFQGESYAQRAAYLGGVAELLADLSTSAPERHAERLAAGAAAIAAHGKILDHRAKSSIAPDLGQRWSALRAAMRAGAYDDDHRWTFGKARLAKDVLGTFLGSDRGHS